MRRSADVLLRRLEQRIRWVKHDLGEQLTEIEEDLAKLRTLLNDEYPPTVKEPLQPRVEAITKEITDALLELNNLEGQLCGAVTVKEECSK